MIGRIFNFLFGEKSETPAAESIRPCTPISKEDRASDRQIDYIKKLGGNVDSNLSFADASEQITQLTQEDWRRERASKLYQQAEAATLNQKILIERLGGKTTSIKSKYDASQTIKRLQKDEWRVRRAEQLFERLGWPVSPRQQMVARFWNVPEKKSSEEASQWQDEFYRQDSDHLEAWQLWKRENSDSDSSDDPNQVPAGIGSTYLRRIKDKKAAKVLRLKQQEDRRSAIEDRRLAKAKKPVKLNPILNTNNKSGFRGVYKRGEKFGAQLGIKGRKVKVGYFDTAEEAARAYDAVARERLGPSARLNFP
jgi:hypothetical protein